MNNFDDIGFQKKNVKGNVLIVTYPFEKYAIENLYDMFTEIKRLFVTKDVLMIPEDIKLYTSTKELIDIKNRIEKELQRRNVKNVKKIL